MLNCKDSTRLLSASQDRSLTVGERIALKVHLLICKGCANYRRQLDFLRQACGRLRTPSANDKKNRQ
jgi:hypothetical protein